MKPSLKRIVAIAISSALLATALSLPGCSETGEGYSIKRTTVNGLPSVLATAKLSGEATVDAVDFDSRTIALTGPDGKSEFFTVGPEVRNFAQIKKGDVVKVTYEENIQADVQKVGEPIHTTIGGSVQRAPLGEKPGFMAARTVRTVANVKAIDYTARTVTLIGMEGHTVTLPVSEKLKNFDKVKVGDQVVFNYTETVEIEVK
jgi:hypothetical protein